MDDLSGDHFARLLEEERNSGRGAVACLMTGLDTASDMASSAVASGSNGSSSKKRAIESGSMGLSEDPKLADAKIIELTNKVKQLNDANIVLTQQTESQDKIIKSLKDKIAGLEKELVEAKSSTGDAVHISKSKAYDQSILSFKEEEMEKIIDQVCSENIDPFRDRVKQVAQNPDVTDEEVKSSLGKIIAEKTHSKARCKFLMMPRMILLLLMQTVTPKADAFVLGGVASHQASANLDDHFSTAILHRKTCSRPYKKFTHIPTGKNFYSVPACNRYLAQLQAGSTIRPAAQDFVLPPLYTPAPPSQLVIDSPPSAAPTLTPKLLRLAKQLSLVDEAAPFRSTRRLVLSDSVLMAPRVQALRVKAMESLAAIPAVVAPPHVFEPPPQAHEPIPQELDELSKEVAAILPYVNAISVHAAPGEETWLQRIAGGADMHSRTETSELTRAVQDMFLRANPRTVARFRIAQDYIQQWHSERGYKLWFPVPPAYYHNMATDKMESSKAWTEGTGGASIAPTFIQVIRHAEIHWGYPASASSRVAQVEPYQPDSKEESCFVPLGCWDRIQQIACGIIPASVGQVYQARQMDIMAMGSARSIEHMRTSPASTYVLPQDPAQFRIGKSKSKKEKNVHFALRPVGLRGRDLPYLHKGSEFMAQYATLGPCPAMFDSLGRPTEQLDKAVRIGKRSRVLEESSLQSAFNKRGYQIFVTCGYDEQRRKAMRLTMHSFHSTFDNVGQELRWPADVCGTRAFPKNGRLGRWAEGMAGGYASEPACRDQYRLRIAVVDAINERCDGKDFPDEPTMAILTSDENYRQSKYYGKNFDY